MNKIYNIERSTITELLNDLDNFETKMGKIKEKYPKYGYKITINKDNDGGWNADVEITKDEKIKIT